MKRLFLSIFIICTSVLCENPDRFIKEMRSKKEWRIPSCKSTECTNQERFYSLIFNVVPPSSNHVIPMQKDAQYQDMQRFLKHNPEFIPSKENIGYLEEVFDIEKRFTEQWGAHGTGGNENRIRIEIAREILKRLKRGT